MDHGEISPLLKLAGWTYVAGTVPYLYRILTGKDRPSLSSWLVWLIVDAISLAGMWQKNQLNGLIIAATSCSVFTVICAFWRGTWEWERIDTICVALSGAGIVLWQILGDATAAILICAVVNLIAAWPTVTRAWHEPARENRFTWACYEASCVLTLIGLATWTIDSAAQPLSYTIVETVMVVLVFFRR